MLLGCRVTLGEIDEAQRNTVPAGRGAHKEERIYNLIVGLCSVTNRAEHVVFWDRHVVHFEGTRLVTSQAQSVPFGWLGFDLVAHNEEVRQIGVVSRKIWAGGLDDIPVGKPTRSGPRRLLAHLPATIDTLGPGRNWIPEVRTGFRVRVGQRANKHVPIKALHQVPDG